MLRTRSSLLTRSALTFALALLLVPALAYAQARTYTVGSGNGRLRFVSDAPLETIRGVSNDLRGSIQFDPANLSSVSGRFEVPVSSLRTGIDLRDEHLRGENWLDAGNHPNIVLEVTRVSGASSLTPNEEARVTLHGRLTMHGQTRNVTAQARVKLVTDDGPEHLRARARLSVNLPDYGVSVPALVRAKVSDTITIDVNIRAER